MRVRLHGWRSRSELCEYGHRRSFDHDPSISPSPSVWRPLDSLYAKPFLRQRTFLDGIEARGEPPHAPSPDEPVYCYAFSFAYVCGRRLRPPRTCPYQAVQGNLAQE